MKNRRRMASAIGMSIGIATSTLAFVVMSVVEAPALGIFNLSWKSYAILLSIASVLGISFATIALRRKSIVAAFLGVTPSMLIPSLLGPSIYIIGRRSQPLGLAVTIIAVALWGGLLIGWRQAYFWVSTKTGLR